MSYLDDIDAFHAKFGIHYPDPPRLLPGDPPRPEVRAALSETLLELRRFGRSRDSLIAFRVGFMLEELVEYVNAHRDGELAKALDALVDLLYVLLGTVHLHGFNFRRGDRDVLAPIFELAWQRVHAANMAKVKGTGATSSRSASFDVVKPPGWQPPQLEDLVAPIGDDDQTMRRIYDHNL